MKKHGEHDFVCYVCGNTLKGGQSVWVSVGNKGRFLHCLDCAKKKIDNKIGK